ncbi:hypothetical protein J4449_00530 [Candidatus Woesearchaeota archaeon]|nr:hypothetical protein [Candidatus Woesearchaeota archaeon]
MATILSTNLLQFFMPIVIFIFIFTVFFAILNKIKLFSDNKPINSLIAFSVTILFIVVPEARQIIEFATPWFIIFVVFGMLMILAFMFLGVEPDFIREVAKENAIVLGVVIGGTILIFLVSFSQVFGPSIIQYPAAGETSVLALLRKTVLHPKILGLLVLLIIASEVIRRVSYSQK